MKLIKVYSILLRKGNMEKQGGSNNTILMGRISSKKKMRPSLCFLCRDLLIFVFMLVSITFAMFFQKPQPVYQTNNNSNYNTNDYTQNCIFCSKAQTIEIPYKFFKSAYAFKNV